MPATIPIATKVSQLTASALRERAERSGTTVSEELRVAVTRYLADDAPAKREAVTA